MPVSRSPNYGINYAEKKVRLLREEQESWLKDHIEAQACCEFEDHVGDMNQVFGVLLRIDCRVQERYFDGMPNDDELNANLNAAFAHWLETAEGFAKICAAFEERHYDLSGAKELRHNITEAKAFLNSSDVLDGKMIELRDAAVEDHLAGKTAKGFGA